ncbi:MAG: hypothetical protein C4519_18315 [Desulfobacteraceae bacterium]|nr:MAG: hypothetical protein C4519_18315 [Desulfobacteraceae bacterium]
MSARKEKVIGILQPGYLPWLGFFEQMQRADVFVYYDDVQFEKGSWRNRNRIKTAQGPQWLTVPVLTKGHSFPLIKDVRINNAQPWAVKHIKAITQNYGKAFYFAEYASGLFAVLEKKWAFLLDLDVALVTWLREQLGIATPVLFSSELGIAGRNVERLIAIIHHLNGTVFYEGKAGMDYIEPALFQAEGIEVSFQEYEHPVYPQLYDGFTPFLSIIDLVLNCGPDSLAILTGTNSEREHA